METPLALTLILCAVVFSTMLALVNVSLTSAVLSRSNDLAARENNSEIVRRIVSHINETSLTGCDVVVEETSLQINKSNSALKNVMTEMNADNLRLFTYYVVQLQRNLTNIASNVDRLANSTEDCCR